MGRDVTFAFAAVLSADQNVHESQVLPPIQPKMGGRSDDNVILGASVGFDYYIRNRRKTFYLTFGLVLQHLGVGSEFPESLLSSLLFVSASKDFLWRF
jgi:hypothetical protein